MAFKLKSIKQKKTLLIAAVSLVSFGVLGTIAYNMDALNFANLFHVGDSLEEYVDTFDSPDNWQPCQEIPKTATATNKNATPRYARMKIDEYWRLKQSQISDPNDHTTTELSLTWDDNGTTKRYAIINTQNDNDWELKSDGWYYYKTPLQQNQSTNSLLKSVTLNCDANLVTNGTATATQDGQTGESVPTDYAGATYHIYVTMQLSDKEWETPVDPDSLMGIITREVNPDNTAIDFRKYAVKSDNSTIANGNGVNKTTENGRDVYYYRGEVDDNNVIWGGQCWKILRSTDAGGVKLVYNGSASYSFNQQNGQFDHGVCTKNSATLNYGYTNLTHYEFASIGYMYGDYQQQLVDEGSGEPRYYSKGLISDSNGLSLDSSTGNIIASSTDKNIHSIIDDGYYYYCINSEFDPDNYSAIDEQKSRLCYLSNPAGFIVDWFSGLIDDGETSRPLYSLSMNGYQNIEELKADVFGNKYSSTAKNTLESFVTGNSNITQNASDMMDGVFCNDRSIYSGSMSDFGHGFEVLTDVYGYKMATNMYSGFHRNAVDYDNNFHPSLDCPFKRDSFSKNETANSNGALSQSVGLLTADEVTMAGIPFKLSDNSYDTNDAAKNYLHTGSSFLTMSPGYIYGPQPYLFMVANSFLWNGAASGLTGLRPAIVLKGDVKSKKGDGTLNNPYMLSAPFPID